MVRVLHLVLVQVWRKFFLVTLIRSFKSGKYTILKIFFFQHHFFSKLVTTVPILTVLKWLVVITIAAGIIYFIFKILYTDST
jgi:hypothetical protein